MKTKTVCVFKAFLDYVNKQIDSKKGEAYIIVAFVLTIFLSTMLYIGSTGQGQMTVHLNSTEAYIHLQGTGNYGVDLIVTGNGNTIIVGDDVKLGTISFLDLDSTNNRIYLPEGSKSNVINSHGNFIYIGGILQ